MRGSDFPGRDLQTPFDAAVVIPTVLRPSLVQAVGSVFAQDFPGRVQILIGVDVVRGDPGLLDRLAAETPENMALTVWNPGYSTSARHGGLYSNHYSGAIRTVLSYAANSRHVAYLDDDNWWGPDHLATLRRAVEGRHWAFSQRWLVEPGTDAPICIDEWESVGAGTGLYAERFGGFVDPSSLMLDKIVCHDVLPFWSLALDAGGGAEDRVVFDQLLRCHNDGETGGVSTGAATSFYRLSAEDPMHPVRLQMLRAAGILLPSEKAQGGLPLAEALASLPGNFAPKPSISKPAPSKPVSVLVQALMPSLKPADLLMLNAETGERAASFLLAAQAVLDRPAALLAADARWDHPAYAATAEGLAALKTEAVARAFPPEAGDVLDWLAGRGTRVDLLHLGLAETPERLIALARAGWPRLRAGGVMLGEGYLPQRPDLRAAVATLAEDWKLPFLPAEDDGPGEWIVQKVE